MPSLYRDNGGFKLKSFNESWPRLPCLRDNEYIPMSTLVILTILVLAPIGFLVIYLIWETWLKCLKCLLDGDEEQDETDLLLIEACRDEEVETMGDQIIQVAPIIDKLPPDYKFPEKMFKVEADSVSDVLRSSVGSLMSLPMVCQCLTCACVRSMPCRNKTTTSGAVDITGKKAACREVIVAIHKQQLVLTGGITSEDKITNWNLD